MEMFMRNSDIEYLKKYLDSDKLESGIKLLESGVSPQYIVGNVNFYGNVIDVDKSVLIPRFETELLVEKTIGYIYKLFDKMVNIIDIGTGSGCIAITLKKELNANVIAVDVSRDAIDVATSNAIKNDVSIDFILSDVFSNVSGKFDVIISNPPYIREDEEIEDIVRNNEPHLALFAKDNGMYFYDNILKNASGYLNKKFLIAFEIGYEQGNSVRDLAYKYLDNIDVLIEKDYSSKDRFVFIISK